MDYITLLTLIMESGVDTWPVDATKTNSGADYGSQSQKYCYRPTEEVFIIVEFLKMYTHFNTIKSFMNGVILN